MVKKILEKIRANFASALRTVFFIAVLLLGWAALNIINLIKDKQSQFDEKNFRSDLSQLRINSARADVPKGTSTPFLAYFDGTRYRLENDILFGRPRSYHENYEIARALYEDGRIGPDLYKIAAPMRAYAGKILLQIQEIELEESFIKRLELKRVIHAAGTEVIVDSDYKKFQVVNKDRFEKGVITPSKIANENGMEIKLIANRQSLWSGAVDGSDIWLEKGNRLDIIFENLKSGQVPHLVVKSWFRDWVLGLEEDWAEPNNFSAPAAWVSRAPAALATILFAFIAAKRGWGAEWLAAIPFIGGGTSDSGSSGSSGSSGGGTSGEQCVDTSSTTSSSRCSFAYEYLDQKGQYQHVAVSEPRAWHYNTELVEFPKEAISADGKMQVRITSSKRHAIGFIGAAQDIGQVREDYREEAAPLLRAYHSRMKNEVSGVLRHSESGYAHTIPGDTVDLEFAAPESKIAKGEIETYIISASGFYTSLRPSSRMAAGNWRENISQEAKARLASLKPLKGYS